MDTEIIITKIGELVTALEGQQLGKVYDHIPSNPKFPCVIIAPGPELITETGGESFDELSLGLDVWIISSTSKDNRNLQHELFRKVADAFTALDNVDGYIFNTVRTPQPIEINQAKALTSVITGEITI